MSSEQKRARVEELYKFLNLAARNPNVDSTPVIKEIARLLDLPEGTIRQY